MNTQQDMTDELTWLEAPDSPEALAWAAAEHARSQQALSAMPQYGAILDRVVRINESQGQMAPLSRIGELWVRLKKSADRPSGVLQAAASGADGAPAEW